MSGEIGKDIAPPRSGNKPEVSPDELSDAIERSVLAGVGKYLEIIMATKRTGMAPLEPVHLAYFPVFANDKTGSNEVIERGRAEFIRKTTSTPQAVALDVHLGLTPELKSFRAVSFLGGCMLLEETQFDERGGLQGRTYYAEGTQWADSSYVLDAIVTNGTGDPNSTLQPSLLAAAV